MQKSPSQRSISYHFLLDYCAWALLGHLQSYPKQMRPLVYGKSMLTIIFVWQYNWLFNIQIHFWSNFLEKVCHCMITSVPSTSSQCVPEYPFSHSQEYCVVLYPSWHVAGYLQGELVQAGVKIPNVTFHKLAICGIIISL